MSLANIPHDVFVSESATQRKVYIPATADHNGVHGVIVTLEWTCPTCGGPRGEVSDVRSYDGSRILFCHGWVNPCGHVDYYSDVRSEAAANGLNR
jgi:hypothetical protein